MSKAHTACPVENDECWNPRKAEGGMSFSTDIKSKWQGQLPPVDNPSFESRLQRL